MTTRTDAPGIGGLPDNVSIGHTRSPRTHASSFDLGLTRATRDIVRGAPARGVCVGGHLSEEGAFDCTPAKFSVLFVPKYCTLYDRYTNKSAQSVIVIPVIKATPTIVGEAFIFYL